MNIKYILGVILTISLLPILYFQGKRLKNKLPDLPPASGSNGSIIKYSNHTLNILIIGESTMAGVGIDTHENGFPGALAQELSKISDKNINWNVHAESGYNVYRITEEIIPNIVKSDADVIVLGIGANDAFELSSPNKWKKNVHRLITALNSKFPDVPVMFCSIPPISEFPAFPLTMKLIMGGLADILANELINLVAQTPNTYFDNRKIVLTDWTKKLGLSNGKEELFSDGVHPSKIAYQIWGKEMASFVYENIIFKTRQ